MELRAKQQCRLVFMLVFTFLYFLVEIIVGYMTSSLALVSDSFHMISDVIALAIGLACLSISTMDSKNNTYGWVRAEILGALVNSVFLIALCFSIFTEAIQRMVSPQKITNPDLLLIVGSVGMAVNVVGLLMFCGDATGHGHSHGGHSHGGHSHVASVSVVEANGYQEKKNGANEIIGNGSLQLDEHEIQPPPTKMASSSQMNIHGVFLHILGDALGSVVVIVSALVVKFVEADWKDRLDPALSLAMVLIILTTTVPLFKKSAYILLQNVPNHIRISELARKINKQVDGIIGIHELHIWQLAGSRIIATLHIRCQNLRDYVSISKKLKDLFHNEGIHSTTIQPEFVDLEDMPPVRECALECGPDKTCFPNTCCAARTANANPNQSSSNLYGNVNECANGTDLPMDSIYTEDETIPQLATSSDVTHM